MKRCFLNNEKRIMTMDKININQMKHKLEKAGLYPLKKQAETSVHVLEERLNKLLPIAMNEAGVDCWIVLSREYCEDPVFRSLVAWDMPNARRMNALIFLKEGKDRLRRFGIGGLSPASQPFYEQVSFEYGSEFKALVDLLVKYRPKRIAVNRSGNLAMADGLTSWLDDALCEYFPSDLKQSLCSAEDVVVGYMQRVTDLEQELIRTIVDVTHNIINMAFCKKAIVPGKTTTTDLEWLMRDAIADMEAFFWFGPDIDLQRRGSDVSRMFNEIIEKGDLLHCDVGFRPALLYLHSDVQRLCYVLKDGEKEAPEGIEQVLRTGNRFQDIVMSFIMEDRSGNDVFLRSIQQAKNENIVPMLYTHPLGTYGHGAGPVFGQYGQQEIIPGRGEYKIRNNTCYALELNILTPVPEWEDQPVFAYLEEDIFFRDGVAGYLSGRQTELLLA